MPSPPNNADTASASPAAPRGVEVTRLRDLSGQQWRSGIAAWLGWLFDGLDMHLYTPVVVPRSAVMPMTSTLPVDLQIFLTAASTRSSDRPFTTTAAPSCANAVAMARPIPAVEPETKAFLLFSCKSIFAPRKR
jgi:hypothetical protein